MNEHDFEAQLRADGYAEIESQTLEARPGKGRHRHLFPHCPHGGCSPDRSLSKSGRHDR